MGNDCWFSLKVSSIKLKIYPNFYHKKFLILAHLPSSTLRKRLMLIQKSQVSQTKIVYYNYQKERISYAFAKRKLKNFIIDKVIDKVTISCCGLILSTIYWSKALPLGHSWILYNELLNLFKWLNTLTFFHFWNRMQFVAKICNAVLLFDLRKSKDLFLLYWHSNFVWSYLE